MGSWLQTVTDSKGILSIRSLWNVGLHIKMVLKVCNSIAPCFISNSLWWCTEAKKRLCLCSNTFWTWLHFVLHSVPFSCFAYVLLDSVHFPCLLFLPAVLSFIFYSCIVGIEQPQFCSTCITNKELFFSILFCSNLSCFSDSTSIIPYYIKRLIKVPLIKTKYITDKLNKDTNK